MRQLIRENNSSKKFSTAEATACWGDSSTGTNCPEKQTYGLSQMFKLNNYQLNFSVSSVNQNLKRIKNFVLHSDCSVQLERIRTITCMIVSFKKKIPELLTTTPRSLNFCQKINVLIWLIGIKAMTLLFSLKIERRSVFTTNEFIFQEFLRYKQSASVKKQIHRASKLYSIYEEVPESFSDETDINSFFYH